MFIKFNLNRFAPLLAVSLLASFPASAQKYTQTNLVSDTGIGGTKQDANLKNAWGLSRSAASPWWVANNGSNTSTLYGADGTAVPLIVSVPGGPTGTIFNGTPDFVLGSNPAAFVFAAEDGSISAWNGGAVATVVASKPSAVYKGLALASVNGSNYLYAADFHNGAIDVLDGNFHYVELGRHRDNSAKGADARRQIAQELDGSSGGAADTATVLRVALQKDPKAFSLGGGFRGFAPFNVQNLGGTLFVTFAKQDSDRHDEVDGAGLGIVAAFTPEGKLLKIFERGWWLNAPWGLALAPGDFGPFSHQLLVGNFGSGLIAAYNLETGSSEGLMLDASGAPIAISGLWGLSFGNGSKAGALNALYFSAGPNSEANGLFGTLTALNPTEGNSN